MAIADVASWRSGGAERSGFHRRSWRAAWGGLLILPVLVLYGGVFGGGMVEVARLSLDGSRGKHATLSNYTEALTSAYIGGVAVRTLVTALGAVLVCLLLGLPCARYMTGPASRGKLLVTWFVVAPLLVSSVGRIFGWYAILGPGSVLSTALGDVGIGNGSGILSTDAAMIIGLVNLMLPFMVLALASAYAHLDRSLIQAAASLGSSDGATLWRIELPLVRSGVLAGSLIVFALSCSSFVVPALLGNQNTPVIAYQIYLDILTYFNGPAGAALAMIMVAGTLLVMIASMMLIGKPNRAARK